MKTDLELKHAVTAELERDAAVDAAGLYTCGRPWSNLSLRSADSS
jgi:hypothetical protein